MKNLILTVAFSIAGGAMFAQATPEAAPAKAQQTKEAVCPMPDMKQVQALDLSQEQMIQVREIHAECERHCAKAVAETGTMDKEAMKRFEARIEEVLSPEQYERYQALQAERTPERK